MFHTRFVLLIATLFLASCSSVIEGRAVADVWTPSAENPDPSTAIADVQVIAYAGMLHVGAGQRVAYDLAPPAGGPHDAIWAACNGAVYDEAIRSENAVHSLEHGAVWIAYNPDELDAGQIGSLEAFVSGQPYLFISPYPGLDRALSMQSWGHQLKLDDPADVRIGQFINALRANPYTTPEVGATCSAVPGAFDQDNPPLLDLAPVGPDAVEMDGKGADIGVR